MKRLAGSSAGSLQAMLQKRKTKYRKHTKQNTAKTQNKNLKK